MDEEGGEHEGEWSAVDDEFLAAHFTRFFYSTGRKFSPGACKNDANPPNLDLDEEGGEHEGEGSAVDDEAESPHHEPGEDAAYDPVLPARRQALQHRVQPFRRLVLSQNFLTFKKPKNQFQGTNSARLCSLTGRYDNPIPTSLLALIDCLKMPALHSLVLIPLHLKVVLWILIH